MIETSTSIGHSAQASWLAAIVDSSDDAIISETLDGILTSWNPAAERLYGYSADKAIGRPMTILIPPDRLDEEEQILARIARGERVEHLETVRLHKSGLPVAVQVAFSPVRDAAGHVAGATHIARYIAERKRAGAQPPYQEALFDAAKDAVIATDAELRITAWNPAAEVIYGWTAAEVIGRPLPAILQTEIEDRERERLRVATLETGVNRAELVHRRKGGSPVSIETVMRVWRDPQGARAGLVGVNRDITARKRSEELLRESQARTESILASVADAHTLFGRDWRYLYANDAAAREIGRPREEILGRTLWELYPDIVGTELDRQYRRAMDQRIPAAFEFHYNRDDTWREHRFHPASEGLAVFATNITERKVAEALQAQLAAIVEHTDDAIYSKALDGTLLTWNAGAERLYGYAPNEAMGRSVSILIPADKPDELPDIMDRIRRGELLEHFETTRVRKDSALVQVSATISPMRDAAGCIIGASAISRDISERKRAETALEEANARMLTLSAHLSDVQEDERRALARDLHDRVGQNLTALNINLNIVRAQVPSEAAESLDQRIADSLTLVREMTASTREVMVELRPPLLDDYGLIAALRAYADRQARRMNMAIVVTGNEPAPQLPARVALGLFRIVQEALNNVAKHAAATQASVNLDNSAAGIRLTISDNGPGFKQADRPDGAPSGWGLMTMRERAEALGGYFHLETGPGHGTRIEIVIAR